MKNRLPWKVQEYYFFKKRFLTLKKCRIPCIETICANIMLDVSSQWLTVLPFGEI